MPKSKPQDKEEMPTVLQIKSKPMKVNVREIAELRK